MRRRLIWLVLVVLLAAGACAPTEETDSGDDAATAAAAVVQEDPVPAFAAAWQAAYNAADAEALSALYGENAVRFNGIETLTGREAIRQSFVDAFAAGGGQATITVEASDVSGDRAHGRGSWQITATVDGETQTQTGSWLSVIARQADGTWLHHLDGSNADAPPPAPAEDAS